MSEKQKQVEKERKAVLQLLLEKTGLKYKELVDAQVGMWMAGNLDLLTAEEKKQFPHLVFWAKAMTRQIKTYNPNHVFVDTNVLIGAYSGDARYQTDSDCLHYLYSIVGKRLYISTLSVAQLISVYQKRKTNDEIRAIVRELQHRFAIINFTVKDIDSALDQTGADIEDNVQFVLARKQKCRVIITNNYKDYRLLLGAQIIKPSKVRTIAR